MTLYEEATSFALDDITRAVLESLPFAVYYCDTSLTVHYMNQPYADHLGIKIADAIGRKITDFLPQARALQVMQSGKEELYDPSSVRRGKEGQRILVNRIPIHNDFGTVIGFISQLMSVGKGEWNTIWQGIENYKNSATGTPAAHADTPQSTPVSELIIGSSDALALCVQRAKFFAETDEAVLVTGETGVGKELFARAIHGYSRQSAGPLISINCAAISKELICSELFGYAPGAFTGAMRGGKIGQIELAQNGTLFLDEIGDLPFDAQGSLLRVLETHQVQRVNANTSHKVNFRLVAATNRDLKTMIRHGEFREDLYYRINTLNLHIPSLAERREDIPSLVRHFLSKFYKADLLVDEAAMDVLVNHMWPGNVRELRNVLRYAAIYSQYKTITPAYLPSELVDSARTRTHLMRQPELPQLTPPPAQLQTRNAPPTPAQREQPPGDKCPLAEHERYAIARALHGCRNNISRAAALLGISRTTLYKKIQRYGIIIPIPD